MRKPKAKKAKPEPKVEPKAPPPKPPAEVPPEPPTPAPEPTSGLGPQRIERADVFVVKNNGPVKNLAPVQFADWKAPGIAITGDKAAQHARNLRAAAGLLDPDHENYATYLRGFAEQLSPTAVPGKLEDA